MSHVLIKMTGPRSGKVWVDGVEQTSLVEIHFSADVDLDKPASVVLVKRVYGEIEIEGQMDVTCIDNKGSREWVKVNP